MKNLYLVYLDLFLPGLLLLSLVVANDPVKHLRWKFGVLLLRDVSGFEGCALSFGWHVL